MNDTGDVYTPETKVKHFLDSLAYFLLLGHTDGIETNYRRVMHAKREVPASSCPSDIENILYGNGVSSDVAKQEEYAAFQVMLDRLDESAASYETRARQKIKRESMFHKKNRKRIHGGTWYRVDTDGRFMVGDHEYIIDDQELQYQPVPTEYGEYYAMDRILYVNGKFYDMNYDEVKVLG